MQASAQRASNLLKAMANERRLMILCYLTKGERTVSELEALIGISQFIVLPLQFLSSALIALAVAPAWLRGVARYNPVDWAVVASRQALSAATDWSTVLVRLALLATLALVMAGLATRAFRSYQRSL